MGEGAWSSLQGSQQLLGVQVGVKLAGVFSRDLEPSCSSTCFSVPGRSVAVRSCSVGIATRLPAASCTQPVAMSPVNSLTGKSYDSFRGMTRWGGRRALFSLSLLAQADA